MSPVVERWVRLRLLIAASVIAVLFVALVGKAATLQIRDGKKMRALGEQQYLQELILPAPRGSIHDANGVELALSVDVPSAYVNPRLVGDVAGGAAPIAQALGLDVREVEAKLASGRHFEWLKRHISPAEARKIRSLGLVGIGLAEEPQRFYPGLTLAAPVIGAADVDGRGVEGIELSLDAPLRGNRTKLPVIRDRRGDVVMDSTLQASGVAGATVTLTLDRYIQFTAERALADGIRENKAKAGVAVVIDPKSGAILAMASSDARNRPVTDAYEPGSVMKVFSVASALDAGVVKPDDPIDVANGIQLGKHHITDAHKGAPVLSVTEVIQHSSNIGAAKIAWRLGKDRLHDGLERFGFGAKSGIDLPGESGGRMRDAKAWGEAGLTTIAYGYGIQATPLQVAAALAAVANGGTYYRPFIVRRIVDAGGNVVEEASPEPRSAVSARAARQMIEMMKAVMKKGGTGSKIAVPGFIVAGKSGTAYKHDPVTKGYSHDRYMASFMGFAPADDPRIAVLVMMDEPSAGKHMGGEVSGPIFGTITTESLKYLGVPATERVLPKKPADDVLDIDEGAVREATSEDEPPPDVTPLATEMVMIPDFGGLSVAQALGLAQSRGVKIEIEGTGRAKKQFPPAGRALKSITCHVTFDPG